MTPIRKNELEYYEKLISNKFAVQSETLNRKFNNEVDKVVEKTFKGFKKQLKLDSFIAKYQKAKKEYLDFKQNKENKEETLRDKVSNEMAKLKSVLKDKSDSNQWSLDLEDRSYRDDTTFWNEADIDEHIKDACKVEARRFVEKQPVSDDIKRLKKQKEEATNVLYSGSSIKDTVRELHKVFTQSGIEYQLPKVLLGIEAPKK